MKVQAWCRWSRRGLDSGCPMPWGDVRARVGLVQRRPVLLQKLSPTSNWEMRSEKCSCSLRCKVRICICSINSNGCIIVEGERGEGGGV